MPTLQIVVRSVGLTKVDGRESVILTWIIRHFRAFLIVLTVAAVVAGAGYHYVVTQVDEKIRQQFETRLREHYEGLSVSVHSAELIEGEGIEIRGISIVRPTGDVLHAELAHIDEIVIKCNTDWQNLILGKVEAEQIIVNRLKLHAVKQPSGDWSVERLFPLPKFGGLPPPVVIQQGAIALIDPTRDSDQVFVLRDCNLSLIPEVLPTEAISDAQPRQQITGEIRSDQFELASLEGTFDPVLGQWEVWGSVDGLKISSRLIKSLPIEIPSQAKELTGLRATTDVRFRVAGNLEQAEVLNFVATGTIRDARYEDRRLPYAITGIRGNFRCDPSGWKLENVVANSGGTSLRGSVSGNRYDSSSNFRLQASAEQLMLDRRLVAIMPATMEEIWQQFTPLGILNVDFKLQRKNGLYFPAASVDCLDVSFAHEKFPYRLERGTGSIRWENKQIDLNLRAWAARQAVDLQGTFTQHGRETTGKLSFETEGPIPIDQKMLAALQINPEAARAITSLQPRGSLKVSGEVEKKRPEDTQFDMHFVVGLHDCSMRYEKFPYPIDHIYGTAELTEGDWTFQGLEGRNDSGTILCDGSLQKDDSERPGLHLNFRCREVPLEEELRLALSEPMQKAWADLQPIGTLDQLNIQLHYGAEESAASLETAQKKLSVTATAVKQPERPGNHQRQLSVQPVWLPYRIDNLVGTAHYANGEITLQQIRGHHGRTSMSCEGIGSFNDHGWSMQVSRFAADRLHADTDLLTALPDSLSEVASELQIQGPLSLQGSFTASAEHQQADGLQLSWDMTIDLEDGSIMIGVPLEHIHGGIRLIGGSSGKQFVSSGELKVDSLMIRGLQLLDVRGPLWFDRDRLLVGAWVPGDPNGTVPRRLMAHTLGGQIMGDAQVLLKPGAPFNLQMNVVEANLQQVATHFAPSRSGIAGKAFGGIELQGDTTGSHTLRGRGQVRLNDADIYELPVMLAMLKLLSVRRPDTNAFTNSEIDFRIHGEHVYFDRIDFNGDAISLKGNGEVDFQRRLNLKFYTLVGSDQLRTRFLESVLGEASKQILMIQVTGTADRPEVRREAFPGLNESLQQLFPELALPRGESQKPTARSTYGRATNSSERR